MSIKNVFTVYDFLQDYKVVLRLHFRNMDLSFSSEDETESLKATAEAFNPEGIRYF